jgi:hypothetical protein
MRVGFIKTPKLSFPLDFSPMRAACTPTNPYFQSGGEEYEESFRVPCFGRSMLHGAVYFTRA